MSKKRHHLSERQLLIQEYERGFLQAYQGYIQGLELRSESLPYIPWAYGARLCRQSFMLRRIQELEQEKQELRREMRVLKDQLSASERAAIKLQLGHCNEKEEVRNKFAQEKEEMWNKFANEKEVLVRMSTIQHQIVMCELAATKKELELRVALLMKESK
ncbi:hypothetical protein BC939DRAFT_503846 [Gamsiella multidivaricata]|uniref:uncharacterized protein n=1 Tax=Gamsiella multidivaricata TaxID=101098 RepID=UPI00221F2CCD|nr:uncharacterized protein BC939DRAFT_503846 [Gamsiella multidivaricata]KAI7822341.1 hypothetical protein BC939DRAFT_503846 [Gamsiella multidivaricata]